MAEKEAQRTTVADDLKRLLAALPYVTRLPADNPARLAFDDWQRALITQVRVLEGYVQESSPGSYLWITETYGYRDPVADNRTADSDTRADVRL